MQYQYVLLAFFIIWIALVIADHNFCFSDKLPKFVTNRVKLATKQKKKKNGTTKKQRSS